MKAGRTGKPIEQTLVEDGLTPCPHCKRTFNENAASKHIEACGQRVKFMQNRKNNRK